MPGPALSLAFCLAVIWLVPLAAAGVALINTGLGRSRSAAHAMTSSLCASAVNSVPTARSTESSARLSLNNSVHGATSHTAAAVAWPAVPKRIWPWQFSRVPA